MLRLALLVFLVFIPVGAVAGPFGIEQGTKKEQLSILKQLTSFVFTISPPTPHPKFDSYAVTIHPKTGVCKVQAGGVRISTSVYGVEIRNEFENIRELLSNIYGSSDLMDKLSYGSIWDEPRDWMMGLLKKERYLNAIWINESNAHLKDGIRSVFLSVNALTTETGWLSLNYDFDNLGECAELIKNESAKTL